MEDTTTRYYTKNAQTFFADTVAVAMAPLYDRFLPRLPAGWAHPRCGLRLRSRHPGLLAKGLSGHRLRCLPSLADLAERHTGQPVQVLRFQDLEWNREFDGIWACASLLHVPTADLPDALGRLARALARGILYASFKHGRGERTHEGRRFTDLDEAGLQALLRPGPGLTELETWVTEDLRPARAAERWLNTLLAA